MEESKDNVIDFAKVEYKESWLHHPVYGDPSWDTFVRNVDNPVHRGVKSLEWPVNGSLFCDPNSGYWYVFIGHYPVNYGISSEVNCQCTVSRSCDKGLTWEDLGSVFSEEVITFDDYESPVFHVPDVSVIYADGKYHMAFDWVTYDGGWDSLRTKKSGVGYACSENPEGPYQISCQPVIHNGQIPKSGLFKRCDRCYATTIIRRKDDWLFLLLFDGGKNHAWAQAGLTAKNPEGPYSELQALCHVEQDFYHPPLMEYFPAFLHDGYVYAPSTSVALNRSFQMIHRAPIEKAMKPESWEIFQNGSVWHGEKNEYEYEGMWGQTFSGFIDERDRFNVMFPSVDSNNKGTINIASRDWSKPYSAYGFSISGHKGRSIALLMCHLKEIELEAVFDFSGEVVFFWGDTAPVGANQPTSDSTFHDRSMARGYMLHLKRGVWSLVRSFSDQENIEVESGEFVINQNYILKIRHLLSGEASISLNDKDLWSGLLEMHFGQTGILVEEHSNLIVNRFSLVNDIDEAVTNFLYTDALLGAGQGVLGWEEIRSSQFRNGIGAVLKFGGRGKWNFFGIGFNLWLPKGPTYGKVHVLVDGVERLEVDLFNESEVNSQIVLSLKDLENNYHAVVIVGSKDFVIDSLDVISKTSFVGLMNI